MGRAKSHGARFSRPARMSCFNLTVRQKSILGFACHDATGAPISSGPRAWSANERTHEIGKALLFNCLEAMKQQGYGYAIIGGVRPCRLLHQSRSARCPSRTPQPGVYRGLLVARTMRVRHGRKRNRRHPHIAGLEAAAGRLVGAAATSRRSRIDLAGGIRREMRGGRLRRRRRRMVDRSRQRAVARAVVFPRRRILLRLDRQPPPHGDGGRTRGADAHARDRLPPRARTSLPGRA